MKRLWRLIALASVAENLNFTSVSDPQNQVLSVLLFISEGTTDGGEVVSYYTVVGGRKYIYLYVLQGVC